VTLEAFAAIAWPIVMGVIAVGAMLSIKIIRRRQGRRDPSGTGVVPVRPLSAEDARKMFRRYGYAAAGIATVLAIVAIVMATGS